MSWDYDEPRRDELKASAPEVPKHRSKKNTRRWCKGKVGVEHVPVIQEDCGANRWRRVRELYCKWSILFSLKPQYECLHQRVCSTCGKVLEFGVPRRECPDYKGEFPYVDIEKVPCDRCGRPLEEHGRSWRTPCPDRESYFRWESK